MLRRLVKADRVQQDEMTISGVERIIVGTEIVMVMRQSLSRLHVVIARQIEQGNFEIGDAAPVVLELVGLGAHVHQVSAGQRKSRRRHQRIDLGDVFGKRLHRVFLFGDVGVGNLHEAERAFARCRPRHQRKRKVGGRVHAGVKGLDHAITFGERHKHQPPRFSFQGVIALLRSHHHLMPVGDGDPR